MTLRESRRTHRELLPGESLPRLPTLLEQLQLLRGARLGPAPATQDNLPEAGDGHDGDGPEVP